MAEIYQLANQAHRQMMGYIFKDEDGHLVMVDGGTPSEASYVVRLLKSLGGENPVISGWFLTHPHSDHISVFKDIIKNHKDIAIQNVYFNFPSSDFIRTYDPRDIACLEEFESLDIPTHHKIEKGDRFSFGRINVEVLITFDPSVTQNASNNSSAAFMFTVNGKKVLIMGDLGIEGGRRLINAYSKEYLASDYLQLSHHGQNGAPEDVYKYLNPKACLWCTPLWLWENDMGKGPGTGPYATLKTRAWMDKLGVKEHYVMKDGTIEINL
ncbi:MAG: MBL fold metallo-hydrolase [Bacillota bacterium]|nr:MBL fold metallo-hydrolase [Bacillota bacterium]